MTSAHQYHIWDNLEDWDLLQRFLPSRRHGAILLTTRQQALGTLAHGIDLTPLEAEEGMLFLFRRAKILESAATVEQVRELAMTRPDEHAAFLSWAQGNYESAECLGERA